MTANTVRANPRTLPAEARRLRRRLAQAADVIIAALDALDGDPDLEDGNDAEIELDEPSLGATAALNQERAWRWTFNDTDLELDESALIGRRA